MSKKLPVAIIVSHSGLAVPPEVNGRVALSDNQIFNEADVYTNQIFDFRDRVLHWIDFPFARAVLDVNRSPDSGRNRPGDGIVKRNTSYGVPVYHPGQEPDFGLERSLIGRYWQPWHNKLLAIATDERVKLVIDAHSMAAVGPSHFGDPGKLRPRVDVGNLGNENGEVAAARPLPVTAPAPLTRQFGRRLGELLADCPALTPTGPDFALNDPFWGGWNLIAHGNGRQHWLMVEINRALYVGAQDGESTAVAPNGPLITGIRERVWQAIEEIVEL